MSVKLAKAQQQTLEDPDLADVLEGTPDSHAYLGDMLWAQTYALENRDLMTDAALTDVFNLVGAGREVFRINCHHNFSARERHGDRDLWITRKGAIKADKGDWGVIAGSMGTRAYIVEGLDNPESYNSSSHGAGRHLSRGDAKRTLTAGSLREAMKGKAWNENAKGLLDEHPAAYKDIDQVMEDQKDLFRVAHTLHQVVNYKGFWQDDALAMK